MRQKTAIKDYWFAYLLILPSVLYLMIFQLYPLIESIRLSFTDTNLLRPVWHYVGLKNFSYLLTQDTRFWGIVTNSFLWIFGSLIGQFVMAFIVALILNNEFVGRAVWRGLAMVPWMMPVVVVGLIWKWLLDYQHGLINFQLKQLGLIHQSINWFGDSHWVWVSLIFAAVWKGFGYLAVMILAGLKGIPQEIYESAGVDGVNVFQKFWYITLPMLAPVLFISGIVQIITGWTKFEMIWVLTNGGPGYATSILPTYIYTNAFNFYKMGLGSAVAVISTAIVAVLLLIYQKIFRQREID